ncbi:MAG: hypothetical protein JWM73_2443 [Solirubrobacterales bacterium]|nr:hypothetical protein [Solirubrobacterales bacterium]
MHRAAAIARRQHGLVTREQLLAAAISSRTVERWQTKGLLHRVHPGVYRLGHRAPSIEATYLAAALAGGAGVAVCGFAAAHVYGALRRAPAPEVTGPVDLRLRGVITRRLAPLGAGEVRVHRGVPLTAPARTMVDLAGHASLGVLAEISHHLHVAQHLEAQDVLAAMARRGRVNGAAKLRAIYEGDAAVLLSRLERKFVALLRNARLPLPKTNRKAGSFYVDCRWPGLTVELLGFRYHGSRHAWERDQRRAREAYARGDQFRTYTWDDVTETPNVVITELLPLIPMDRAA